MPCELVRAVSNLMEHDSEGLRHCRSATGLIDPHSPEDCRVAAHPNGSTQSKMAPDLIARKRATRTLPCDGYCRAKNLLGVGHEPQVVIGRV